MMTPFTAAFALFDVTAALERSVMGWELANIAASVALLLVAVTAIALFFFRRKSRDLTLIYFGLFCALYAVRLLGGLRIFRSLFEESQAFWQYIDWIITCTIPLPFGLFLLQVGGEHLRRSLRWLVLFQAVFAMFGIVAAALGMKLAKLYIANNILVLATLTVTALFLLISRRSAGSRRPFSREVRIFIGGFLVWFVFILHANLLGLKILSGHNVEFLGFLVFVGCLGYISARRTLANEERLLAISKELEIARQIQSSILPQEVPGLPGLEIAARYVPMSAVAGDFYDLLLVDEKRIGILIADVTGHGVPAALIASMLKVAFAGQSDHADDPAMVLSGLNRALCGKFEQHFVTTAYAFIDTESGVLRYAGAGHPPLMLSRRSARSVQEIEENGLMLGLFPKAAYSATEISLCSGDRCVLYTDGILEAMNSSQEEFGKTRLRQFLEAHPNLSAAQFADKLLDEISCWAGHLSGRSQDDDITLLVLDFEPVTR